jgi:hypothetical protein
MMIQKIINKQINQSGRTTKTLESLADRSATNQPEAAPYRAYLPKFSRDRNTIQLPGSLRCVVLVR